MSMQFLGIRGMSRVRPRDHVIIALTAIRVRQL